MSRQWSCFTGAEPTASRGSLESERVIAFFCPTAIALPHLLLLHLFVGLRCILNAQGRKGKT